MGQLLDQVIVGSYAPASEEAITLYRYNAEAGTLEKTGGISGIESASFLAADAERGFLFAVSETANGHVVSFRKQADGTYAETSRQSSHGDYPCHLTLDASGDWLLAVNYMSGNVLAYPVAADSKLGPASDEAKHEGSSVRTDRQEAPHAHSVFAIPGTDLYLVNDLGTDTVVTYKLDRASGKLAKQAEMKAVPGAGPRHLAFHPTLPIVYVLNELDATVAVCALDRATGKLERQQTISTLPDDFSGDNLCAEIQVSADGRFVYASNRGHDSIVTFQAAADGSLSTVGFTPSGGKVPRNFTLSPDGRYLLAANQESHLLAVMAIQDNGMPQPTGNTYSVTKPVCVRFGKA
ncbi:lactonase family protein [Xylanibacillus composti]|uniref:6-phosphogluconolactonase n=1 Tax=Xylanibacillus composti TaxID=1572762 RepID=A0A8J4H3P7_9BACL|nr:lactonase family protein [Xylanibacillus composti]MDT9726368.1 lactonase family protein [Xylanibacillus composti]GIQ70393.1 hypothetical protein XYCOK13_32170 [Xylanibacillus composti]